MMTAEERSLRNGGHFPPRDTPTVMAVTCSNLRKHGPHLWTVRATAEQRVCPGVKEDHNV